MPMKRLLLIPLILLAVSCQSSPEDSLAAAEAALAKGENAEAIAAVEKGLAADPQKATTRWRLELVGLEARARSGDVEGTIAAIERLAGLDPTQIKPSNYVSTADQLRAGGQAAGAVQLLDKGAKRYPEDAAIKKAISQAKTTGSDDELDALRSLGYLD